MDWAADQILIDLKKGAVEIKNVRGEVETLSLNSARAFKIISDVWVRAGWDTKYVYTFTWLGRPIIQLPEDLLRVQEVIYNIKPDIIIETGVAHGGSLIFYASLCNAMNHGKVIGIDIEIRPHNRQAIENHELFSYISLIEGSSIAEDVILEVNKRVTPDDKVLVILDSNHSRSHVLAELEAYSKLVTPGSYIIATDGIMKDLEGAPRSEEGWSKNNPFHAAQDFLAKNKNFSAEQPAWSFNESENLHKNITYWPGAWLKKIRKE